MKRILWIAAVLSLPLAVSAAAIHLDPGSSVTSVDGTVDLRVEIKDVVDLYAYQFDIAFDPVVLSASTVAEGSFLSTGGGTSFIPGAIDNTAGTVSFTASVLLGSVPGVSGSGTLASIRFNALTIGTSPVTLSNIVLLDSALNDIAAAVQNGSVSVVPEPGSVLLLTSALGIGFLVRLRTRR